MAERQLREIVQAAIERHGLCAAAAEHRIGTVPLSEAVGGGRGLGAAPRPGVRRRARDHRRDQGAGADLEARTGHLDPSHPTARSRRSRVPSRFTRHDHLPSHGRRRLSRIASVRRAAAARQPRDLRRQPRDRLAGEHRAHPQRRVRLPADRHHRAVLHRRADRLRLPLRVAGVADRLPAAAAAHAQGRVLRNPPHARAGEAPPRAVSDRVDQRGLRRPAGPPAARDLLGPRQPDRPARRLRRGQALRRGVDDGLPPPAGRRHGDRPDLQHLRSEDATRTTAARSRRSSARRCRTGRSRCSATAPRHARSVTSTT